VRIFVGPLCGLGKRTLRISGLLLMLMMTRSSRDHSCSWHSRKGKAATTHSEIASTVIQSITWQGGARGCAPRPAVR
jgi:hypothetical protein